MRRSKRNRLARHSRKAERVFSDHRKRERARVAEVKAKKRAEERENNRLNNKANAEAKYKEDEEAGKITGGAPVQAFVADFDPKEETELELMRKTGYKRVSIREVGSIVHCEAS